jgi:hypothetical protein
MKSTFLVVSSVIDTADHKKSDLKVEYLCEIESIYETPLTRGSWAQIELFDLKNQRSIIS